MWMLPLYLHVNKKSNDDDDDITAWSEISNEIVILTQATL